MILTGQCKADFEKWYNENMPTIEFTVNEDGEKEQYKICLKQFLEHPNSMKYGVYVLFAFEVGEMDIYFKPNKGRFSTYIDDATTQGSHILTGYVYADNPLNAMTKTVEKFDELYNQRTKPDQFRVC